MDQIFHQGHHRPTTQLNKLQNTGTGTSHSKIILMGEHAVVYDFPAIAMPFAACQVKVSIQASPKETNINCRYFNGPLDQAPQHLDNLVTATRLTLESFHLPKQALEITIESQIPNERGMGSSAAVSVALIRALCDYHQVNISDYQLRLITNEAEVIAHDSTSGIDTLVTSGYQPLIYRKSQQAQAFSIDLDAYLIVADSGQVGQTKQAVQHVALLRQQKPEFVDSIMASIGHFVNQAYQAIKDQDILNLGRLMTYNHYYLNQLGVSNSLLDQIVNAAWLAGALGAKLTGGGMGGCLIALAEDAIHAQLIAQAMEDAGAKQTWLLDLSTSTGKKEN